MADHRPGLTILACRYCGGVPVEMAGIRRLGYPAAVKVVDVPCTGTISPLHLLAAFEQGADGVLVVACPSGGCHHLDGERRADRRVAHARAALFEAGLDPERLRVVHLGIGHAGAFVEAVREMSAALAGPAGAPQHTAEDASVPRSPAADSGAPLPAPNRATPAG
jgi:F420-non-reducing hydrogenase iron-sulfur subunit